MSTGFEPGLIASQWGETAHALIQARRPDLPRLKLAPGASLATLPDTARVLLARPFALADRQAPAPAG